MNERLSLRKMQFSLYSHVVHNVCAQADYINGEDAAIACRIGVYQNAYLSRLQESLAQDFPVVRALLGELNFNNVVEDYLQKHPPASFTIADAGNRLPDFLSMHLVSRSQPYLCDVAKVELAKLRCFYAPNTTPLRFENIAEHELYDVKLKLNPSVEIVETEFDILHLMGGSRSEEITGREQCHFLVWRNEDSDATFEKVDSVQASILKRLKAGALLAELFTQKESCTGLDPQKVEMWFIKWIERKIFSDGHDINS